MGIVQTAPAFGSFTVKPRIGSLKHASITVPTLRGPILVNATHSHTSVTVPCGAMALLCVEHGLDVHALADGQAPSTVRLDGAVVAAVLDGPRHACAKNVGCGAANVARVLTLA